VILLRGTPILTCIIFLLLASPASAWGPNDPSDAHDDPDGDGLDNVGEFLAGTNPLKVDTDGGGCPDGWEVRYDLDPTDPADDLADTDNDGWSNIREFLEGTDPRNPNTDDDLYPLDSTDPYPLIPYGKAKPPEDPDPDDWIGQEGGETMGQGQDGGQGNLPGREDRPYQGSDWNREYDGGYPPEYRRDGGDAGKDADFDGLIEFIASL
jgi:hypothetical protein